MRHEASFLKDILAACRKIERITAGTSEDPFLSDEVLPAAILHHLTVIGEAICRLPPNSGIGISKYHGGKSWRYGTESCMRTLIWTGRSCGMRPRVIIPSRGNRF